MGYFFNDIPADESPIIVGFHVAQKKYLWAERGLSPLERLFPKELLENNPNLPNDLLGVLDMMPYEWRTKNLAVHSAWAQYSESLDDFAEAVRRLRLGVMHRSSWELDYLLSKSSPTVTNAGIKFTCPSLLVTLAIIAAEEMTAGYRLRQCASCHAIFTTSAYQAKYCSQRCQWRELKRRHNEKEQGVRSSKVTDIVRRKQ